MTRMSSHPVAQITAWPQTLLHDGRGSPFVGFTMAKAEGELVHHLYGFTSRETHFPKADWRFLIRVARNAAAVLDRLHACCLRIGDINEKGFVVGKDALVKVIDCDSFQIQHNGRLWRCEVGVPTYTPPELQRTDLSTVTRSVNHDCFGLAVLIFHLLFMGRHPFAGRYLGSGEMPLERAIRECRFAYAASAASAQMSPPPFALRLGHLHAGVGALFEKAFSPDARTNDTRPRPKDWVCALDALEKSVKKCPSWSGHFFYSSLSHCPWCEIMNGGGPNFFMAASYVTVATVTVSEADVESVWRRISSVKYLSPALPVRPNRQGVGVKAKPMPTSALNDRRLARFANACIVLSVGVLFFGIVNAGALVIGLIALASFWVLKRAVVTGEYHRERTERATALKKQAEAVKAIEQQWERLAASAMGEFGRDSSRGMKLKDTIRGIGKREEEEIAKLKSQSRKLQLDRFLAGIVIADNKIEAIGPTRKVVLRSYGIETAADIEENRLWRIPGFGSGLIGNLLAWRKDREARFVFDPKQDVSRRDIAGVQGKFQQEKLRLHAEYKGIPGKLSALSEGYTKAFHLLNEQLTAQWQNQAQAAADASVR